MKIAMSSITVETRKYINETGHNPRGYGSWAFQIGNETVFFSGTYSDTVKMAKKVASEEGQYSIKVLS